MREMTSEVFDFEKFFLAHRIENDNLGVASGSVADQSGHGSGGGEGTRFGLV